MILKKTQKVRKIMSRVESLLAEGKAEAKAELLSQINEQAEQITKQKTRIEDLESLVAQYKQQSKLNISF